MLKITSPARNPARFAGQHSRPSLVRNEAKIGAWVRDSTVGIGTLSFVTEKEKASAALGHAVLAKINRYPDSASAGIQHCTFVAVYRHVCEFKQIKRNAVVCYGKRKSFGCTRTCGFGCGYRQFAECQSI